MPTISAGSSQTFTAGVKDQLFTLTANGGALGLVTGAASASFGPGAERRSFGPFAVGQAITVTVQAGSVIVEYGDATPEGDGSVSSVLSGAQIAAGAAGVVASTSDGMPILSPTGEVVSGGTPQTATGRYTGTGAAQTITLGFRPDLVVIKGNSTQVAVFKHNGQWHRQMDTLTDGGASRAQAVTFTDTGFSVGTDATVSTNTVVYDYFAFADNNSGVIRGYSWHGNATTGRTVSAFQNKSLAAVIVKRDATMAPVIGVGTSAWKEDGTAAAYLSIGTDGVLTLNNSNETNQWAGVSGEGCNSLALFDKPDHVCVMNYTGNATARRIPLPWQADFVMIWPRGNTASKIQMWFGSLGANETALSNGAVHQTGRISSVDASGVNITNHASVNTNGVGFTLVAFRRRGTAAPRQFPAIITRRNKSVQLSTGYINCGTSDTLALSGAYSLEFYGSFTPADETALVGGATVNDELNKQYPLIWRSNGTDAGSSSSTVSWGMELCAPQTYGPVGEWTGCSIIAPSGPWMSLAQNSSANLDYHPINTGYVIDSGRIAHIVASHDGNGVWRFYVDGVRIKERNRSILTAAGGPLRPDGAYPLAGATTVIGARLRGTGTPEFAHSLNFRLARLYSRGLNDAEVLARFKSVTLGYSDAVTDFVEEWDANNASGSLLKATRDASNNGTITNGIVIG